MTEWTCNQCAPKMQPCRGTFPGVEPPAHCPGDGKPCQWEPALSDPCHVCGDEEAEFGEMCRSCEEIRADRVDDELRF